MAAALLAREHDRLRLCTGMWTASLPGVGGVWGIGLPITDSADGANGVTLKDRLHSAIRRASRSVSCSCSHAQA
jgi:hypothetical protein